MGEQAEPRIVAARVQAGRVFIDLSNGAIVAVPVSAIAGLVAEGEAHAHVVMADEGHVLHWPELGLYVSYLSILTDVLGARAHMTRIAEPVIGRARERAERARTEGKLKRPRR